MTKENDLLIIATAEQVSKHFEIESFQTDTLTETLLLSQLIQAINYLLDHDFNKLLTILYRIDIDENDFQKTLTTTAPGDLGRTLAIQIIEREKAKVISRRKYGEA